jgi:arabinan endo-1,5-alpha-L-arabinosidase
MRLLRLLAMTVALFLLAGVAVPALAAAAPAPDQPPASAPIVGQLRGDITLHDPALAKGPGAREWFVYSSGDPGKDGGTVQVRKSVDDGRTWAYLGTVWPAIPKWITDIVPDADTMWAPEIIRHGNTYYLYYAVSTLGHNDSVIALATNTTLDPKAPGYRWVDQGKVVRSLPASDFNAIDPEVVEDDTGTPWLVFGSYWSGIQMVQLEWPSGKRSADKTRHHLADRKVSLNAVEAPSIVRHGGWYYLLTSWDRCCKGVDSTYRIVVGRSKTVTGPYVDRDGRELMQGGGTTLLESSGDRIGPGGESVSGGVIAYHYYDGTADGAPKLGLRSLTWADDGWPKLGPGDQIAGRPTTS